MGSEPDPTGLGAVLNQALRSLSETMRAPWTLLRPGERVEPLVSNSEAASQAPTREATPGPQERPPRRVRPPPWVVPETIPEPTPAEEEEQAPEPAPEAPAKRKRPRKRRRASGSPQPASPRPPSPRPPTPQPAKRAEARKDDVSPLARALARRARPGEPVARVTPSAYDAVDTQARFGLIECARVDAGRGELRPQAGPGETLLLAHTPPRRDPRALVDLRPGDSVSVLGTRAGGRAVLRIGFVTRSGYVAPGRAITSVVLGVPSADWARALQAPA